MTKYIHYNYFLRCRLKSTGYKNQVELQIQKNIFWCWVNVYQWMHVQEDTAGDRWLDDIDLPPRKHHYQFGNASEVYSCGKLNINERVKDFFKEYFLYKKEKSKRNEILKRVS